MTQYHSPLHEALRSLEQYGNTYYCRNYSYGLSSNTHFVYRASDNLFFTFAGNDDAYLFINGELVMEVGGTHSAAEATFNLNDYVQTAKANVAASEAAGKQPSARDQALALEDGQTYSLDFYYLQRKGTEANLRIATNIRVTDSEQEDETAKLYAYSLSLNGNIGVNLYMDLPDAVANEEGAYLKLELPGVARTELQLTVEEAVQAAVDGKTYYKFSCGVAAKEMTEEILVQMVHADGTAASEEYSVTVKDYADFVLANPDNYSEELVNLVKAMLNYGGYTQIKLQYNTENLANADLNLEHQMPELDDAYSAKITGSVERLTYNGSSLMTTSETGIRHYFSVDGDISDYSFTCNGKTLVPVAISGSYYVEIPNISAKNLGTMYTLSINNGACTISYSAYSYAKIVLENNYDADLKNAVSAMYQYGEAAKQYFGTANAN